MMDRNISRNLKRKDVNSYSQTKKHYIIGVLEVIYYCRWLLYLGKKHYAAFGLKQLFYRRSATYCTHYAQS